MGLAVSRDTVPELCLLHTGSYCSSQLFFSCFLLRFVNPSCWKVSLHHFGYDTGEKKIKNTNYFLFKGFV